MGSTEDDKLRLKLTDDELKRIRDLVVTLHEENGGPIPHEALVSLASAVEHPTVVTVDFKTNESLGVPMVILQVDSESETDSRLESLSPRERSVAQLIAQGLGNKQIAASLGISLLTVKDHVHRILVKTGLPNRAAIAAVSRGKYDPSE